MPIPSCRRGVVRGLWVYGFYLWEWCFWHTNYDGKQLKNEYPKRLLPLSESARIWHPGTKRVNISFSSPGCAPRHSCNDCSIGRWNVRANPLEHPGLSKYKLSSLVHGLLTGLLCFCPISFGFCPVSYVIDEFVYLCICECHSDVASTIRTETLGIT